MATPSQQADFLAQHEIFHLAMHMDKQITALLTNEKIDAKVRAMAARHLIRVHNQLKTWTPASEHSSALTRPST